MFKMKLMSLLKNPVICGLLVVAILTPIIASIIAVCSVTKADTQINVAFRSAGMGVNAGNKEILVPEVAPDQGDNEKGKYNNVYCIDEGTHLSYETYGTELNLYGNPSYAKNYGSLLWVVDNMFISTSSNKDVELQYLADTLTSPAVKAKISGYGNISSDQIIALNKTVGNGSDTNGNTVNRNLIEVLEQLVIWNYTNNSEPIDVNSLVNGGISGIGNTDQNACKYFYYAMKYLADSNSKYTSNGNTQNVVSLDASKATLDTTNKKIGPYVLKSNGIVMNISKAADKISTTITKADGKTATLGKDVIKTNNDGSFYIDISTCGDVRKSVLNVTGIYSGATTTALIITNGVTQNLLNIKKDVKSINLTDKKEVSITGKYTIKLFKTKEDGKTVIVNNPATFTISGALEKKSAQIGNDGLLVIADGKTIKSEKDTDTYKILEDVAPKGFEKYNGEINLSVNFKNNGKEYVLNKDTTKLTSTGTNGTVNLKFLDDTTIAIYVPNVQKDGNYDFVITKKDEATGSTITSDETTFYVKPYEDIDLKKQVELKNSKGETIKTGEMVTKGGILSSLNNIKISKEMIGKTYYYLVEETVAPDEYTAIEYRIVIPVSFVQENDTYVAKYSKDAYRIDNSGKKLEGLDKVEILQNGMVLNVNVPNKKNKGNYDFVITKKDEATGSVITSDETTFKINVYENSDLKTEVKLKDSNDSEIKTGEIKTISGILSTIKNIKITESMIGKTYYYVIEETKAPDEYTAINYRVVIPVSFSQKGNEYFAVYSKDAYRIDAENKKLDGLDKVSVVQNGITINVDVLNKHQDFDFSLRKFITGVNNTEVTNRIPQVDITDLASGKSTTAKYNHTKEPVEVCPTDIVTYTLRVYNEGPISGYVAEVKDDIPNGVEFIKDNATNKEYKWKLLDAENKETTDVSKAKYIVTDYLAKDAEGKNLIKAFDPKTMKELDYRDVKIAFKVIEPSTSDRIITNYAQISKETDSHGNNGNDRDSTPNVWNEGEDDQDIEKIKVKYFDLALRKWVTQAIVTEDGKTTITETGHKAEDNPEAVVKVDLKKSKINNVTVKFRYSIRVTNQGEIPGYAKEISDYIPTGLKFVASDNKDWTEADGKVTTKALENTLLQPGESAEVSIILTWINDSNNMGVKTNIAEISKDHNEYGTPDIDSTPNNKVPGEDDIDDAPVMLTVKTGSEIILYTTIGLGILTIIGIGVIGIKKYIIK